MRDLTGKKIERWTVIEYVGRKYATEKSKYPSHYYLCECDCGTRREVNYDNLATSSSRSCGCLHKDTAPIKHGYSRWKNESKVYKTWQSIKDRCHNPKCTAYEKYGAKGVVVCDRWLNSFPDFVADMGEPPTSKHSIDRINVYGNYEPDNCRWATNHEQSRNRTDNVWIEYQGRTQCAEDWAKEFDIPAPTLRRRLKEGWSLGRALTTPAVIDYETDKIRRTKARKEFGEKQKQLKQISKS